MNDMQKDDNAMETYSISTLEPAPSMNHHREVIEVRGYAEAVEAARESWRQTGRHTYLFSGQYGTHWWHRIEPNGIATDRSGHGIPEVEDIGTPPPIAAGGMR